MLAKEFSKATFGAVSKNRMPDSRRGCHGAETGTAEQGHFGPGFSR